MKQYVVYDINNLSIIALTDNRPDLRLLPSSHDYDTVANWLCLDKYRNAIESFIAKTKR